MASGGELGSRSSLSSLSEFESSSSFSGYVAEESDTSGITSIFDKLRSPTPSDLSRKRKIQTNKPPVGKKRSKGGSTSSSLKSISPKDRVSEFDGEALTVSVGKLFCTACREELSMKKSVVSNHVSSAKHRAAKIRLDKKQQHEMDISDALQQYTEGIHPKGEHLSDQTRVYRVKVVEAFLKAGIPLTNMDSFRDLLEESAFSLSSSQHMRDLIPFILSNEQKRIREELQAKKISVIFDGTTHVAEALAIIVRYVSTDWKICQRLVRVLLVTKSMCGEEVAHELIGTLSIKLGIPSDSILAAMRDRCSVNSVAMRTFQVVYPNVLDIGCFSHTLDNVGKKFKTPNLDEFTKLWISLFSHSPKARIAWKTCTGVSVRTYSETRWWSRWEVIDQLHNLFGDVEGFLDNEMAPATKEKLLEFLSHPQKKVLLKTELAVVVDAGRPLVEATYILEGDGPLIIQAYEQVRKVEASFATAYYPNTQAVAQSIALTANNPTLVQSLIDYAKTCVLPCEEYFASKFNEANGELAPVLAAFKACRLFSPSQLYAMKPSVQAVDDLGAVPFLRSKLSSLKTELPRYIAASEDVSSETSVLDWWEKNGCKLPHWADAFKLSLLAQPSSAAAERVFSLLQNSFGNRQQSSLEDYIETSLMLQYNKR